MCVYVCCVNTHTWGGEEVEGWSKKEKGLMDMDNSVVIAGGRGL